MNWEFLKLIFQGPFGYFIVAAIIMFIAVVLIKFFRFLINKHILEATNELRVDMTNYKFLKNAITLIIFSLAFFAIIYTIPRFRTLALTLFAGAGIFAAVIGFASQAAFSNIISGIFIVIFKPFRVSDRIQIGTAISGIVEDITLRHTIIRNFENRRIIIPNSIISSEVVLNSNIIDEKICKHLEFGISYDADVDKAIKIIQEEAMSHPYFIDNRTDEEKENNDPSVQVRVIGFGDSSVNLKAWIWTKDSPSAFQMGCDLRKSIKYRFDHEGIEIPFPYRTIVYKKDL